MLPPLKRQTSPAMRRVLEVMRAEPERWWRARELAGAAGVHELTAGRMLREFSAAGWVATQRLPARPGGRQVRGYRLVPQVAKRIMA